MGAVESSGEGESVLEVAGEGEGVAGAVGGGEFLVGVGLELGVEGGLGDEAFELLRVDGELLLGECGGVFEGVVDALPEGPGLVFGA